MAEDEFLTVAEIATLLKLNQQTIRNWIDAGELRAVRVGRRRVRVRRSELDRFIAAGEQMGPPASDAEHGRGLSSAAALAQLRSQLERASADDDPKTISEALLAIARVAQEAAESITREDTTS
jgi:excisionase family DNA binding protein